MAAAKPTSLRAYAKHRGVSAEAVSKAITAGRLRSSVIQVGGQPKIADVELADREWDENTRPRVDQPTSTRTAAKKADHDDEDDGDLPADVPPYKVSRAVREAHAARREGALADLAELDVSEKLEELVPAAEVRAYIDEKFTLIKTRFLGIPSRVAQQMPDVAERVAPIVETLISEVLEELAVDEDDGDDEDD